MVTVPGIIMVARYTPNSLPEPRNGSLLNTNAAIVAESTATTVHATANSRLLLVARAKEKPCILNTRSYPSSVGRSGIQRMGSVRMASDPLNEEESIHRKGSTVSSATAVKNR